jgi:xanthine dehydrogenase accessory factor
VDPESEDWPLFGLRDDVRAALAALAPETSAVLVTLIAARGGSPRELGAQMLVTAADVVGYVSGGCVEADVARHARALLGGGGASTRLVYGDGGPMDVRLPCGGRIELLLEHLPPGDEAVRRLLVAFRTRVPALWLTDGERRACLFPGEVAPQGFERAFDAAVAGGVCGEAGGAWFRRHDPVARLVVVGADPPALAIASLSAQAGLETTLVRPKGPTTAPALNGVAYLRDDPATGLARLAVDRWTAVAAASHDPELDDPAVIAALKGGAGYVGVLGSRNKIEARLHRLAEAGVDPSRLAALHAPIGLPIGGKSPWHIGVAAIAEITNVLNLARTESAWPGPGQGGRLAAVVLAAGAARRFGGGKLLAPLEEGVLLDGALAAAFAAPVDRVVVVTGSGADRVADAAHSFAGRVGQAQRLHIVLAPDHGLGLSASLKAGVRACAEADGVLVFLGDMPGIPPAAAEAVARSLAEGAVAAATVADGRRGHPVGLSRRLFPEVLDLVGDGGAGVLLDRLGAAVALTPIARQALADVDTREDLAGLAANKIAPR